MKNWYLLLTPLEWLLKTSLVFFVLFSGSLALLLNSYHRFLIWGIILLDYLRIALSLTTLLRVGVLVV